MLVVSALAPHLRLTIVCFHAAMLKTRLLALPGGSISNTLSSDTGNAVLNSLSLVMRTRGLESVNRARFGLAAHKQKMKPDASLSHSKCGCPPRSKRLGQVMRMPHGSLHLAFPPAEVNTLRHLKRGDGSSAEQVRSLT